MFGPLKDEDIFVHEDFELLQEFENGRCGYKIKTIVSWDLCLSIFTVNCWSLSIFQLFECDIMKGRSTNFSFNIKWT